MRGDPLALEEDLDGPGGQPDVDFGAGEAVRDAIIMGVGFDVIINADTARAPFVEDVARVHQLNSIFAIFRVSDHDNALVLKSRCL